MELVQMERAIKKGITGIITSCSNPTTYLFEVLVDGINGDEPAYIFSRYLHGYNMSQTLDDGIKMFKEESHIN